MLNAHTVAIVIIFFYKTIKDTFVSTRTRFGMLISLLEFYDKSMNIGKRKNPPKQESKLLAI